MEVVLLILSLVTLIVLITSRNSLTDRVDKLQRMVDELTRELKKFQSGAAQVIQPKLKEEPVAKPIPPIPAAVKVPEPIKEVRPEVPVEKVLATPIETSKPAVVPEVKKAVPVMPAVPSKPPRPGFFERNPDLEKFIGENLANKVGIGILVLGIAFFVKYAIDKEWIGEIGRVAIGILCGGILIGAAHYLRKTFTAFSSVLVGGGIAVLYFTIYIAFHDYQIFNQTVAFLIMVVITGFTVVLSIAYDRMELAILGILGGFGSPFMVSTGEGNYVVLFTYILILDLGMLTLAYFKKWNPVTIVAYAFTIILFGSWMGVQFDNTKPNMIVGGIVFATLFYFTFFGMTIINNVKERTKFNPMEITLLLSNTFLYFGAGLTLLTNDYGDVYRGLFTAMLGIFNFVFAYTLYKKERIDRNLVFLLIGLVLTFISLAAPIQLKGNHITLFWAAESVLLLWLSQKSGITLMKIASSVIVILMGISLIMDLHKVYIVANDPLMIILNKGYITGLVSIIALGLIVRLLRNESKDSVLPVFEYRILLTLALVVLTYSIHLLELRHHLIAASLELSAQEIIMATYSMLFIVLLFVFEQKLGMIDEYKPVFAGWGPVAVAAYLFFYHGQIIEARTVMIDGTASALGFVFHYIYVVLLIIVAVFSLRRMRTLTEFNAQTFNMYAWFYVAFFVFMASAELDHIVALIAHDPAMTETAIEQNHKIGYPVLWGITSFILIAVGLRDKIRHLRIISLSLFCLTLLKLFLFDIRDISEAGKILAFISLGILLLVVSFMYQRLKKLIMADEQKSASAKEEESKTGDNSTI